MFLCLTEFSTLASVFKLIILLIVFIGLLFAAHYFTRWYAKTQSTRAGQGNSNIVIVESRALSPGKSIVIAKIGKKYVSFVLCKENATLLTELKEEDLDFSAPQTEQITFREAFKKAAVKMKKK